MLLRAKRGRSGRLLRAALVSLVPVVLVLSGCSGWIGTANNASASTNALFSISPGVTVIDTNCTGCNRGSAEWFGATLATGGAADVTWSLPEGGNSGSIDPSTGQYTPPSYLSADAVQVKVTAVLRSNQAETASATITVTPGFLQPLSPENFAVGAGGSVQVIGYIAEAGGTTGIGFKLADTPAGTGNGQGSLGTSECTRSDKAFTFCSITYTAPVTVTKPEAVYIVATAGGAQARESTLVLLNAEGVQSSPAAHQQQSGGIALGSSGGNNNDYDTRNGNIVDCCSGTLGALVENSSGTQYLLSNNHVLARTDQASVGEAIVQPGLIDSSCTPYPAGKVTPVGVLTGWVPIQSSTTNVDAAIAQVNSGAVNENGAILELGTRQSNGTLTPAPPGVSSSGGRGEAAALNMSVAKSGRTTGLTCGGVSAVSLDVKVSYYSDCAETHPYYTKTFTNQIGMAGSQFSDAGDSGALVVDASNAEPVGLLFAGGEDASGVGQGVANPAGEVLSELSSNVGNGVGYTFVGGADHPVSCLNYGTGVSAAAQAAALSGAELARGELALAQARILVNPSAGVYGVALGRSSDRTGEAAVVVYVDPSGKASVPPTVGGVRTVVISASMQAVAVGTAPQFAADAGAVPAPTLRSAIAIKQQIAARLMKRNPAFFGVGVGESYDNPRESALVVYVDRGQVPARLPATIRGLRVRYIVMDRLHVTRAYLSETQARSHCVPHPTPAASLNLIDSHRLRELRLF